MDLTYKNEIEQYKVKENVDEETLSNYDFFYNDFSKQQEKNNSLFIKYDNKILNGSDNEFETIMEMFPEFIFEIIGQNLYRYYRRITKENTVAKLHYSGSYISRFDLIDIEIDLTEQELELILKTFNLTK